MQYRIGTILYGQLAERIFEKCKNHANVTRGKILNMLEEDSYRLINLSYFMVEVVMVPMQLAYGVYMMSYTLGLRLFVNYVYMFVGYCGFCGGLAWVDFRLNRKLMAQKDKRTEKTLEYINFQAKGYSNE